MDLKVGDTLQVTRDNGKTWTNLDRIKGESDANEAVRRVMATKGYQIRYRVRRGCIVVLGDSKPLEKCRQVTLFLWSKDGDKARETTPPISEVAHRKAIKTTPPSIPSFTSHGPALAGRVRNRRHDLTACGA